MNFANFESFAKFIQLKFEPLCCNTYAQHKFANLFQQIPSKQLSATKYKRYSVIQWSPAYIVLLIICSVSILTLSANTVAALIRMHNIIMS